MPVYIQRNVCILCDFLLKSLTKIFSPFSPRKYTVISSPEQRQRYKNDFNAEYSEYRDLHARIEGITRQFTVLDNELKQLQQGTEKYKVDSVRDAHKSTLWVKKLSILFFRFFHLFCVFFSSQTIHNQILQEYHKIKKVSLSPMTTDLITWRKEQYQIVTMCFFLFLAD